MQLAWGRLARNNAAQAKVSLASRCISNRQISDIFVSAVREFFAFP